MSTRKITGLRPAPPPYGAAPLPHTEVGAKCLAAVVFAHPDCALSLNTSFLFARLDHKTK